MNALIVNFMNILDFNVSLINIIFYDRFQILIILLLKVGDEEKK